jgi:hypothetical protein
LNDTAWLICGFVGENVKRAMVGPVLGKSSAVNSTYVGEDWVSVTGFFRRQRSSARVLRGEGHLRLRRRRGPVRIGVRVRFRERDGELLRLPGGDIPTVFPLANA